MEENKDRQELSMDQMDMATGGGATEAEAYLRQLSAQKGVEFGEVFDLMTPEEYQNYYNLYNGVPEMPLRHNVPVDIEVLYPPH